MTRKIVEQFHIPSRTAKAFVVKKGHVLRIHMVEGKQVGDCTFWNADDYKEVFHIGQSWAYNVALGHGTAKSFKHFYSKPPRENVMFTVLEDTCKNHWLSMGGRCSRRWYEARGYDPSHPNCQESLTNAIAPYGLTGDDIFDIFNVFMNADLFPDGKFEIKTPERGDHSIDMRAEMNVLAAISACPSDTLPTNDWNPKPLGVTIYEG